METMTQAQKIADLDRRIAERRAADRLEAMTIKAFANHHSWTDIEPFEVIRKVSDKCVEVREMKTEQIKFPQQFFVGGFSGHYADNRSGQEYTYTSDESCPVRRIRWSESKQKWQDAYGNRFVMADKPYKFYDYNF